MMMMILVYIRDIDKRYNRRETLVTVTPLLVYDDNNDNDDDDDDGDDGDDVDDDDDDDYTCY